MLSLLLASLLTTTSAAAAAAIKAPKCCFINSDEFNAFAPTSQVCSVVSTSGSQTTLSCPSGGASHSSTGQFLSIVVPSLHTGSASVAYVAECRSAKGSAIISKAILCQGAEEAAEMHWTSSIMNGQLCAETGEEPFRLVQFTPKTAGLSC